MNIHYLRLVLLIVAGCASTASAKINLVPVGEGWARNSVNANILRHSSVVSDGKVQYVAYYDDETNVILAKRELGSETWEVRKTQYQGKARDAHNIISLGLDGDGYLHVSWDHHGNPLRYARSVAPGSLELTENMPMIGEGEKRVTYPEFYSLPDGDLIFLYRDGGAGRGSLMMNYYDLKTKTWTRRQTAFIDGEGKRSPYWQMCTDPNGTIHISWVWRAGRGVQTNQDMGYAKSEDRGKTWLKSNGEAYNLPITFDNAEYAARIPQNHELINTTGITADDSGLPYIATYFRPEGTEVPQYHLIYHDGSEWHTSQVTDRKTPFTLKGGGTKRIPIARPRIVANSSGPTTKAYMLYRDIERDERVSVAKCEDITDPKWEFADLTDFSVGMWEPSLDIEMWKRSKTFHIYVQYVGQGDGEKTEDIPPTEISILEWKP